jgi:hypothetical protein
MHGIWLWPVTMGIVVLFAIFLGRRLKGRWDGIFIDERNKISLSRLQVIAWTVLILSSLLVAVMVNLIERAASPLNVVVPAQLWIVLGIGVGSAAVAPAIQGIKRDQTPATAAAAAMPTAARNVVAAPAAGAPAPTAATGGTAPVSMGVLVCNWTPQGATWIDLFRGEELGNFETVDIGKLQMFLITIILMLGYGATILALFAKGGEITSLPLIDTGMDVLLGISHAGYLANKAVNRTPHA